MKPRWINPTGFQKVFGAVSHALNYLNLSIILTIKLVVIHNFPVRLSAFRTRAPGAIYLREADRAVLKYGEGSITEENRALVPRSLRVSGYARQQASCCGGQS